MANRSDYIPKKWNHGFHRLHGFNFTMKSLKSGMSKIALAKMETIITDERPVKLTEAATSAINTKMFNNHNQTLSKLRGTFLPKLMKGEIRVKTKD